MTPRQSDSSEEDDSGDEELEDEGPPLKFVLAGDTTGSGIDYNVLEKESWQKLEEYCKVRELPGTHFLSRSPSLQSVKRPSSFAHPEKNFKRAHAYTLNSQDAVGIYEQPRCGRDLSHSKTTRFQQELVIRNRRERGTPSSDQRPSY